MAKDRGGIDPEQIDEWLRDGHKPEDVKSLLQQITKAVLERALQGELTQHLGYAKNDTAGRNSGNSRNGASVKKLKGDFGEIELETPRDRNGEFEPQLVPARKGNYMKRTSERKRIPSAESIARKADRGENVSRFFTNAGEMHEPVQRVNVDFTSSM